MRAIKILLFFVMVAGSVPAQDWFNVGSEGITSGQEARAIIAFDGNLVMGGKFSALDGVPASNIAVWDGTSWSQLGDGIFGDVRCMAVYNNELYIGGNINNNADFTVDLPSVCKLVDGAWVGVSNEDTVGIADDMMVWNGELYVVSNSWSQPNKIMKYDGAQWYQVGPIVSEYEDPGTIHCVEVFNDELYIAGRFAELGTGGANRIAKFNGSDWESVDFPVPGFQGDIIVGWINDLHVFNGELFAGGSIHDFSGEAPTSTPRLARLSADGWVGYSFDMNSGGEIQKLITFNDRLFCGGEFGYWDSPGELSIAVNLYDTADANAFIDLAFYQEGASGVEVLDMAVINDELYVCGDFDIFGTSGSSSGIARFNGVIPGPVSSVEEIASSDLFIPYPNPGHSTLSIAVKDKVWLEMYDSTGKLISAESYPKGTHSIVTADWPAGIYYFVATGNQSRQTQNVVVSH